MRHLFEDGARSCAALLRGSAAVALAALLSACGDGSSSGSGGSGGSGGTTTTTTTVPMYEACPIKAEPHVLAVIVGVDGKAVGTTPVSVTGVVAASGIDTPPSFECGGGLAWVQVAAGDGTGTWLVCFQALGLQLNVMPGDSAELVQTVQEHPIAPASVHTTLHAAGALVAHIEQAQAEEEIALPDGVTIARADQVCASPDDPCNLEGYAATATSAGQTSPLPPGELVTLGAYQIYLDRYWVQHISSGCDGGGADIRLSVTPAPP